MTDAGASTDPAATAVQHASMLADVGRNDDALAVVRAALADYPDDERLLFSAAWLHLRMDDAAAARPILLELFAAQPTAPNPAYLLSIAEASLGNFGPATDYADRALELAPDNPRYHLQVAIAETWGTIGETERAFARERIASALELAPHDTFVLKTSAEIEWRLGNVPDARVLLHRALAIEPDNTDLLYFDALLTGAVADQSNKKDFASVWALSQQVGSMGAVLGSTPDHEGAGQVLFVRIWTQLLRVASLPFGPLVVSTIALGIAMGNGATVALLLIGAIIALVWPFVRFVKARLVLSKAPTGYVRQQALGGSGGRIRLAGTATAAVIALAAIVSLVFLRDAVAVRWLLVAIAVAGVLGGAALAAWFDRYLTSATRAGIIGDTPDGIATLARFRKTLGQMLVARFCVALVGGFFVFLISTSTRADAAPVLAVVLLAWVMPPAWALWRVNRMAGRSNGLLAVVVALLLAALVFALSLVPWAPGLRDGDGTYRPYWGTVQNDEETPVKLPDFNAPIEVPEIDVPDFDVPEIDIPAP
ncbi:hypothetical protein BH10ACT7_BH10ACT7_16220 [soil metagenome]